MSVDEPWVSSEDKRKQDVAKVILASHPDDLAVDKFAAAMKAKFAQKRAEGRGGWEDKGFCSQEYLSKLLREHVDKGDPLDVANLAMMLHQRGESIAPQVFMSEKRRLLDEETIDLVATAIREAFRDGWKMANESGMEDDWEDAFRFWVGHP